jgi:hypothetical protein
MTAICGGGTSSAKPGFQQVVVVGSTAVESALILYGLESLAAVLAPIIAGLTFDLTNFCTTDPPADPGLVEQDLKDALNPQNPLVWFPAVAKIRTWFESHYWYDLCQCVSVATPAAPALSNPGTIGINTGLPAAPNGACFSGNATDTLTSSHTTQTHDLTGALLPTNGVPINGDVIIGTFASVITKVYPIPPTITSFTITNQTIQNDPSLNPNVVHSNFFTTDSSGNVIDSTSLSSYGSDHSVLTQTITRGVPSLWSSSATYYGIASHYAFDVTASNVPMTTTYTTSATCNGQALGQECCPPDPTIDNKLNQILGLLQSIYLGLPTPLTSYASGTVHSGLSGSGSVILSGSALAIEVNITTDPATLGESPGTPTFLFDRGYIQPFINFGPVGRERRLTANPQVILLPELTEQVGYTLHPGVTISITELLRGP